MFRACSLAANSVRRASASSAACCFSLSTSAFSLASCNQDRQLSLARYSDSGRYSTVASDSGRHSTVAGIRQWHLTVAGPECARITHPFPLGDQQRVYSFLRITCTHPQETGSRPATRYLEAYRCTGRSTYRSTHSCGKHSRALSARGWSSGMHA